MRILYKKTGTFLHLDRCLLTSLSWGCLPEKNPTRIAKITNHVVRINAQTCKVLNVAKHVKTRITNVRRT
nr:MAG TPA: hypothetical protein [Caudoviricetes sp.]